LRLATLAVSACLLAFAGTAPTLAAPVSGAGSANAQTDRGVTPVQYGQYRKKNFGGKHRGHKHGFRPGSRHAHAPKGWHRHSRRPSYWQTRGCVVVGPVWFCP
jgi:hypothetical protein